MALTPSTMLPLGSAAPDFALPDASGQLHRLSDASGAPAVVVMFICNHCPYVKHIREELARLGRDYAARGVAVFAINSNDAQRYPSDAPAAMAAEAKRWGYTFPYLVDQTQTVAKAYQAACTPDFYVFDANLSLAYRGQLDDSRPGNGKPVNGAELRAAIDALLAGEAPPAEQTPSIGCGIKWKPGNAPSYFG